MADEGSRLRSYSITAACLHAWGAGSARRTRGKRLALPPSPEASPPPGRTALHDIEERARLGWEHIQTRPQRCQSARPPRAGPGTEGELRAHGSAASHPGKGLCPLAGPPRCLTLRGRRRRDPPLSRRGLRPHPGPSASRAGRAPPRCPGPRRSTDATPGHPDKGGVRGGEAPPRRLQLRAHPAALRRRRPFPSSAARPEFPQRRAARPGLLPPVSAQPLRAASAFLPPRRVRRRGAAPPPSPARRRLRAGAERGPELRRRPRPLSPARPNSTGSSRHKGESLPPPARAPVPPRRPRRPAPPRTIEVAPGRKNTIHDSQSALPRRDSGKTSSHTRAGSRAPSPTNSLKEMTHKSLSEDCYNFTFLCV
ncbi:serine/arginine-rich splicing factor SR45-like [Empidonax traillii]|uniref:serine/arginine-rich splicing factor SR45-like n=1 Tax=Empidonax traillii TaxID=164674 RepID=UPI000FFD56E5|nr:serine/arginine-rich splicing factor SR45-like [Empidonax traillii]